MGEVGENLVDRDTLIRKKARRDTLIRDRKKARTAAEIVAIEARIAWANNHNLEACPEDIIPTPEKIAAWLPNCREEARSKANALLAQVVETDLVNPHWSGEGRWASLSRLAERPDRTVLVAAGFVATGPKDEMALTLRGIELPAVHEAWQAIPEGKRPRDHPLAPLVEAWQGEQPIEVKRDTKNNAIMPAPLAIVRDLQSEQGELFGISLTSKPGFHVADGWLPTMEPEVKEAVESLPLILFDAAGGTSMAPGRGAPLALRLWVESILSVPCPGRLSRTSRVTCTLEELIRQLWPNGWTGPGRDAPKLERAFSQLQQAYVPWEGGRWLAVAVRNRPDYHNLKSSVVFDVSLPPGSGHGPMVHRPTLRKYGVKSAAAYRLALGLAYLWNKYLTHKGKRLPPTVPVVERNPAGVVVDVHGRPLQRSGRPVTHWSDPRAARTGNYERNLEMERLPWLTPDQLLSLGSPYCQAGGRPLSGAGRRKALERVRQAADEMGKAGDVAIEKKDRRIRLAPPDWWGNPKGKV